MNEQTRRQFLLRTGCAGLGAMALSAGFEKLGLMDLYAQEAARPAAAAAGYRALVCIFLFGGNDSSNMVIPTYTTRVELGFSYNGLFRRSGSLRGSRSRWPASCPLNPAAFGFRPRPVAARDPEPVQPGKAGGRHECRAARSSRLTRTTYRNGSRAEAYQPLLPFRSAGDLAERARRRSLAERWAGADGDQVVLEERGSAFPVTTSVAGSAVFGQGLSTRPLVLPREPPQSGARALGFSTSAADVARRSAFDLLRTIDRSATLDRRGERRDVGSSRRHERDHRRSGARDGLSRARAWATS